MALDSIINNPYVQTGLSYASDIVADQRAQLVTIAVVAAICLKQIYTAFDKARTTSEPIAAQPEVKTQVQKTAPDGTPLTKEVDGKHVPDMEEQVTPEVKAQPGVYKELKDIEWKKLALQVWKPLVGTTFSIVATVAVLKV